MKVVQSFWNASTLLRFVFADRVPLSVGHWSWQPGHIISFVYNLDVNGTGLGFRVWVKGLGFWVMARGEALHIYIYIYIYVYAMSYDAHSIHAIWDMHVLKAIRTRASMLCRIAPVQDTHTQSFTSYTSIVLEKFATRRALPIWRRR